MTIRDLFSGRGIRILLAAKIVLIVGFVLVISRQISFEEKSGMAEKNTKDSAHAETGKETSSLPETTENIDSTPPPSDTVGELIAQTEVDDENFSILEGLLELPPLRKDTKEAMGQYLTLADRARQQADDRIKTLERRAKYLRKIEKTITEKLEKLEKERSFVVTTIQKEKKIQKDRLDTIVKLYAKMEPKKASPMIEKMDKDLVVGLFKQLKEKQVTAILEGMAPDKSVEITEYFARVGSVREYDLLKEVNKSLQDAFDKCRTK